MSITKNKKSDIIKDFGKNGKDSGSPNVQAAILTERIKNLTDHLKTHSKDFLNIILNHIKIEIVKGKYHVPNI